MITMEEALNNLLAQGIISPEDARAALAKASDEGFGDDEPEEDVDVDVDTTSQTDKKEEEGAYSF